MYALIRHPASPCAAVTGLAVTVARGAQGLQLRYRLTGQAVGLSVPAPLPPGPADGLWRHTCFECFVAGEGAAYREFNLSPSGQWAVYDFTDYRRQNESFRAAARPRIRFMASGGALELEAWLPEVLLPGGSALGLSAVVEAVDGGLSYWALVHPGERPDFHHRDGFVLELPVKCGRAFAVPPSGGLN